MPRAPRVFLSTFAVCAWCAWTIRRKPSMTDRTYAPTVAIRPCAYNKVAWLGRYTRADSKLQDLPAILREAIRRRYVPATPTGMQTDLEFVPWPCLLSAKRSPPPRLGSFTVFSGAWATFALELFDDSR